MPSRHNILDVYNLEGIARGENYPFPVAQGSDGVHVKPTAPPEWSISVAWGALRLPFAPRSASKRADPERLPHLAFPGSRKPPPFAPRMPS